MLLIVPWLTTADLRISVAIAVIVPILTWVGGNLIGRRPPFADPAHRLG